MRRVNIIISLAFNLHLVAIKEGSKIENAKRTRNTTKTYSWLAEGKTKTIRSEKAHCLVFIEAIIESESIVQQPM